jgi:hypothetical protein
MKFCTRFVLKLKLHCSNTNKIKRGHAQSELNYVRPLLPAMKYKTGTPPTPPGDSLTHRQTAHRTQKNKINGLKLVILSGGNACAPCVA